jgi:hypothetical protein
MLALPGGGGVRVWGEGVGGAVTLSLAELKA